MSNTAGQVDLGRLPDVRVAFQLMGLHVRKVDAHWTYRSHEHPMYELHWVVDGEMDMIINGETYHQQKGDLLFIRPGVTHSCKNAGPQGFTYFSVHFSVYDTAFSKELERYQDVYYPAYSPLVGGLSPALTALYDLAVEHLHKSLTASKRMKVHAAVFELLGSLVEQLSLHDSASLSRKETIALRIAEMIEDSVRFILYHDQVPDQQKTWIHDIAKAVKMSPSQVNRVFRDVYGKAPRAFMSETLLNEAKRLLHQTDLTVDHIAMMLGYKTNAHFSRQFKRWTGATPSEHRTLSRQRT
ncbi:helix-turn-helix domain-containing protein [Paenibacillus thalictri]|uniref:AraC family transcriptional regulator n=1 Tax=Paenibacillus thalictri TaxID=2527873 RepID=A0A4Q9DFQ5_9BACL|nr:AraC family transcriptional regulator [Paenibacillus thalictri]TBL69712.1 AraC family transcriptional regulator [Paenibacillus thalictri]